MGHTYCGQPVDSARVRELIRQTENLQDNILHWTHTLWDDNDHWEMDASNVWVYTGDKTAPVPMRQIPRPGGDPDKKEIWLVADDSIPDDLRALPLMTAVRRLFRSSDVLQDAMTELLDLLFQLDGIVYDPTNDTFGVPPQETPKTEEEERQLDIEVANALQETT